MSDGYSSRAVIEVNPDALAIARTRDEERVHGYIRGPLHGIPFLVKDVGLEFCTHYAATHFLVAYVITAAHIM